MTNIVFHKENDDRKIIKKTIINQLCSKKPMKIPLFIFGMCTGEKKAGKNRWSHSSTRLFLYFVSREQNVTSG